MMESNGNRTLFQALRVPFDLKAIFLAFLGLVVLWAGGEVLGYFYKTSAISDKVAEFKDLVPDASEVQVAEVKKELSENLEIDVVSGIKHGAASRIIDSRFAANWFATSYPLTTIQFILGLIWWLLVLSVFGGAVCRVTASRIARDEGVGVREALKFSMANIQTYLAAPIFVVAAILFFWACILLAGVVTSIPVIGPILNLILYPLVILAGLIIVLIGFAGILGLFLMVAAVSAERNGALDAISRAFSYIYSRPLQFFFSYFVIFLFAFVIFFVGQLFIGTVASSFDTGVWSDDLTAAIQNNWRKDANTPSCEGVDGFYCIAAFWIWLLHRILWLGVMAYVVFYVLGGTTSIYFQLRRDVDGTEESEIYLADGGEDEFDFSVTDTTEAPPAATEPAAAEPEAKEPEATEPEATEPEAAEEAPAEKKDEDGEAPEEDKSEGE
jgi:hypothetical protein